MSCLRTGAASHLALAVFQAPLAQFLEPAHYILIG